LKKRNRHKKQTGKRREWSFSPKNRSALTWISGSLFICGLAIMAGIYWERNATVNEVRYINNHFTDVHELDSVIEAPIGLHPDSINYQELIKAARSLPYVEGAGIRVDARGRMIIDIDERNPIAMLLEGNNRVYIDEQGVRMPVILQKTVNVPLLHNPGFKSENGQLAGDAFKAVRDFLIAARNNEFGWITISEVGFNPEEGVIALSHENGVKLIFGFAGFEERMIHWEAFYSEIIRKEGIDQFSLIDLRYRNQIVTR
jgi:cell division protein FtsQ